MDYKKCRDKVCTMIDQLFDKPDLSPVEIKNATEAFALLHKINEVERGESMRNEYGSSYGANSWVASGPYPDDGYGDNYGRQMRSSRTGRFMDDMNHMPYGHSIKDRMVANMEDMMDQAKSNYEKQYIQSKIRELRRDDNM